MDQTTRGARARSRRWALGLAGGLAVIGLCGSAVASGRSPSRPLAVAQDEAEVFVGITPVRALDTRSGGGSAFGADETRTLSLGSVVPLEATSAVINVTLDRATGPSFITVWPTGETRPNASVNNAEPGQVMPNTMIAKLGTARSLEIYNERNSVDVIVDVVGYYLPFSEVTGVASSPAVIGAPGGGGGGGLPTALLESTTYEPVATFTAPVDGSFMLAGYIDVHWSDPTAAIALGTAATTFCRWADGNNIELGASITADVTALAVTVPGLNTSNIAVPGVADDFTAGETINLECRVDQVLAAGTEVEVAATFSATPVGSIS